MIPAFNQVGPQSKHDMLGVLIQCHMVSQRPTQTLNHFPIPDMRDVDTLNI
jgi:hypothetical protein